MRNILSPASPDAGEASEVRSQTGVVDAIDTHKIDESGKRKKKKKSHVRQLYKDVDADDQLKLLHSNIYIGDDGAADRGLAHAQSNPDGQLFEGSQQYLIGPQSTRVPVASAILEADGLDRNK